MNRILIVDDEEVARLSLAEILKLEGYLIRTAASGEAAVDLLRRETFDVMILDLKMPGMGGMDVLRTIVDTLPDLKVIVLTAHGSMDTAIQALRYRVHDYLLKPATPAQIIKSIQGALEQRQREKYHAELLARAPQLMSFPGGAEMDLNRRIIRWRGGEVSLTPTEAKLLGILYQLKGQVITHSELVLICQGYRVDNEEAARILRPVVSRLRQKLESVPGWNEWIKNVRGSGYVLDFTSAQG
ncbi:MULTISPECIES: response regulator transcription factor [Anaerolinea]|uniref:OmpR family two-component response regulator n=1 Tax=Anaerolinea thermophila (strain DSM 14523 / JCM 11388 / NBRC 100420 / UNI-1) TaxID=926569 RepID=E8N445_ANATU|nr:MULTISPECIES: response regulator transcription factor [Anaerolinea]BAJ63209.1 OmpR family two-component response regulator [Anaerolinea thermophila UNI-1]